MCCDNFVSPLQTTSKQFYDYVMVRHTCLIWLLILIGHMYLSGMWLGMTLRRDTKKTCVLKRDWTTCLLYTNEPKRHNSSCYNTVCYVEHLDNGLTFMPVQCRGVIFSFLFFSTNEPIMYPILKTPK